MSDKYKIKIVYASPFWKQEIRKCIKEEDTWLLFDQYRKSQKCIQCDENSYEIYRHGECNSPICKPCLALEPLICTICNQNIKLDLINDILFKNLCLMMPQQEAILEPISEHVNNIKRNNKGETKLHQIVSNVLKGKPRNSIQDVKNLLQNGANPNTYDSVGNTPLHEAVTFLDLDMIYLLIINGALVDAYTEEGNTSLHLAIDSFSQETKDKSQSVIEMLLNCGASVDARNLKGETPLDCAMKQGINLKSGNQPYIYERKLAPVRPFLIYPCELNIDYYKTLVVFCKSYNIKMCKHNEKFSKSVTHVIVDNDPCSTTPEILMAILQGCYVLNMNWVVNSMKRGKVLPFKEIYEVKGTTDFPMTNVFKKARETVSYLRPKLFSGGHFVLAPLEFTAEEKKEINQLVTLGGSELLKREYKSTEDYRSDTKFFYASSPSSFVAFYKNKPEIIYNMENIKSCHISSLYNWIQNFEIKFI